MTEQERMAENMLIAKTIQQQLGGGRMAVMTGARDFMVWDRGLKFRLPSTMTKDRINIVIVTLTPADLYRVEWMRMRKQKGIPTVHTIHTDEDVFAEDLIPLFESRTGLYTSL